MNKTKVLGIILVLAAAIGLAVHVGSGASNGNGVNGQPKETVKIGLSLPLTGNVAFLGESAQNAAKLAMAELGSSTKYKYELVIEDDSFNPAKTASAVQKLINVDKVSALISFGSGTGNVARPIAEAAKVPHFALASDPTVAEGEYNYIHWTPAYKEGELLAKEIVARGYKRVSIVDTKHPGTLAVTDAIKKALAGTDIQIVSYDLENVGQKDFRTTISKIKTAKPDIIVLELFSPEIEIIAKQLKEQGIKTPTTSVETFAWSNDINLFEGQWFVADAKVDPAFVEKYSKAYGKNPAPGATYIYDLILFLAKVNEASGTGKPIAAADMPKAISSLGSYNSALFGNVAIDKDGFFVTEASVQIIKNGKVEQVDK